MTHFINLNDFDVKTLQGIIDKAISLKQAYKRGEINEQLKHKTLAMIFDKPSTRTRVSFETGIAQLGGQAIFLSKNDIQIGRDEPVEDTARIISPMLNGVILRISSHQDIQTFADHSTIPIINALSDQSHPCQIMADVMTYQEMKGNIANKTVAWLGDGNNVCQTYIQAAAVFNFTLNIACPSNHNPDERLLNSTDHVNICSSAEQACTNADLVVTDVWQSMPPPTEQETPLSTECIDTFMAYQVNKRLMSCANKDALFTHCLPAHRGKEVTADILDNEQISIAWQAAENRLHAQKALLLYLFQQA